MSTADPYGTYVKTLHYRVIISDRSKYENPQPVPKFDDAKAEYELADGKLVVTLKHDHASVDVARSAIETTLRAWEVLSDLQYSPGEFRFAFEKYETAHRNPPPPGTIVPGTVAIQCEGAQVNAVGTVTPPTRRAYPAPPLRFSLTVDVQTMFDRLMWSIADREPTASMAYFCLTVAEGPAAPRMKGTPPRRRAAALRLAIDEAVLNKLGELSSERGGSFARKAGGSAPLTEGEATWLRTVIGELIVRLGAHAAGAKLRQLTMADLPTI
jgi:hypothetical protein